MRLTDPLKFQSSSRNAIFDQYAYFLVLYLIPPRDNSLIEFSHTCANTNQWDWQRIFGPFRRTNMVMDFKKRTFAFHH